MRLPFLLAAASVSLAAIVACSSSDGGSSSGAPASGDGGVGTSSSSSSGSVSTTPPTVLASGQQKPGGIASNGTVVAWTTLVGLAGGNLNGNGPIMTVPVAGGTPTALVPSTDTGAEIAIDATNVYWFGPDDSSINKAALAGGGPVQIFKNLANSPYGMVVSPTTFYWSNLVGIHDVLLTGGANTTFVTLADAGGYNPQYNTQQIAVSSAGVFMFTDAQILAIPPSGGSFTTYATVANASAIVADATSVYWAVGGGGGVMKAPVANGASPTVLAPLGITEVPSLMAVDATNLYFIELGGSLKKVPLAGGAAVTLAAAPALPGGLAIDATNIYWTDVNGGNVYKLAK